MLKIEGLREKLSRCKSFRMCRSEGVMEVLILKGLQEAVFGSADSKGVAGAGGAWPIVHAALYTRSKQVSRGFCTSPRFAPRSMGHPAFD